MRMEARIISGQSCVSKQASNAGSISFGYGRYGAGEQWRGCWHSVPDTRPSQLADDPALCGTVRHEPDAFARRKTRIR